MVPFIDIKRFEDGFLDQWQDVVATMSRDAAFVGGPAVAGLEARIAAYCGVAHTVGCANGTDAIQIALRTLGVGPGDRVLVPDMTFWATLEAVVNVGASPVTVDISVEDGGVDFDAFARAIECEQPKAAIIAHLYGWGTCHLERLRSHCADRGVLLIEDGAQCFGVRWQDRPIYSDALISTVSFYPAKVLGAAGDAGAVLTNDPELAARARRLANHGRTSHYGFGDVGWNSRLDALQAAFLNLGMDYLDERITSRRASAQFYRDHIQDSRLNLMGPPSGYAENGYCNVLLLGDLDLKAAIEAAFRENAIGFGNIYPDQLSLQDGAKGVVKATYGGDNARALCAGVLNLPLFPYMQEEELEEVLAVLNSVI